MGGFGPWRRRERRVEQSLFLTFGIELLEISP